jgi:homoserine dehydrogenase
MASVDVPVALLGYGTVGAAVNRLLNEQADDIERATGHRLRVVKALVRDLDKERSWPAPEGVLTTNVEEILGDPSIKVIAEVMGGVEPTGSYVLDCLRSGKNVVSATSRWSRAAGPSCSRPRRSRACSCASRRAYARRSP